MHNGVVFRQSQILLHSSHQEVRDTSPALEGRWACDRFDQEIEQKCALRHLRLYHKSYASVSLATAHMLLEPGGPT